jgi:hypothetical protein
MTILRILLVTLAISSLANAQQYEENDGLTPKSRDRSLHITEEKKFANATQGLQYVVSRDIDCDDTTNDCDITIQVNVNYHYNEVTITDYVNDAGKVVTSRSSKEIQNIDQTGSELESGNWEYGSSYDLGLTPTDESAQAQLEELYGEASNLVLLQIRKKIYEGGDICADSFYK